MVVLGIESSCDETGVALCDSASWAARARPALASGHARRLWRGRSGARVPRPHPAHPAAHAQDPRPRQGCGSADIGGVAYTRGPGLAGALLVGASTAHGLAYALGVPVIGVHHLEGHLLSPLLADPAPAFPFVALLVSGGHTQLMRVAGVGDYTLLGETVDDAAGEAFDKSAKLLGLGYPGGPALSRLAEQGRAGRFKLPRPMLASGDLEFQLQRAQDRGADDRSREERSMSADVRTSQRKLRRRSLKC